LNLNAGCKRGQNGSVELKIPFLKIGRRDFFVFRAGEIRKKMKNVKNVVIVLLSEIIAKSISKISFKTLSISPLELAGSNP
jgi:hypothetical protein